MAAVRSPGPFNDNFPTPPASSIAPSTHGPPLPKPRKHPLKSGGPKESELIRYLDHALGNVVKNVQNRPHRRRRASDGIEEVRDTEGYRTFAEAAKDLDGVVDVVWVSGSRMSKPLLYRQVTERANDQDQKQTCRFHT